MVAERRNPPVLCIVGRKNSGKTRLVEKLVAGLKAAGRRVAAVKHDAHRFEIDLPGKDSFRFTAAGADTTVISSREKTAFVFRHAEEPPLEWVLSRCAEGVDIILAEGYKASPFPKIEVRRKAAGTPMLHLPPPGLIAVATDENVDMPVPRFDIDDIEGILAFIEEKMLGRGKNAE